MDNMPSEILELIFSYLNAVDRGRMALVCKKWNTILEDDFAWTGVIKGAPIPSSYVINIKIFFKYIINVNIG